MPVAAYLRCSTDRQEDSPEVQLGLIREYCLREGLDIVAIYVDTDVSGGVLIEKRPAFRQLLEDRASKGFQSVVILNIDRFSRDLFDGLSFERAAKKHKLQVVYVREHFEDSASGDLNKHIKLAFAEFERRQTGERVHDHNRRRAITGRWPAGTPPLGYVYDPTTEKITIDPDRIEDAKAVFQAYIDCHGNPCAAARRLNSLGIRTRNGNAWRECAVRAIVRNPFYRGRIHYNEIETETDIIPPAIPRALLDRAELFVTARGSSRTRASRRVYTYSGLLICAECGSTYKVQEVRERFEKYICRGRAEGGHCRAPRITSNQLNKMVGWGLERAFNAEVYEIPDASSTAIQTANSIARKVTALRNRQARLKELYANGLIDSLDELTAKLSDADAAIAELVTIPPRATVFTQELQEAVHRFSSYWIDATTAERRSLLMTFCPRIYVIPPPNRSLRLCTRIAVGEIEVSDLDCSLT